MKARPYRKRSADEDAEAAPVEAPSEETLRQRLEETRRLQQDRLAARSRGVETGRLAGLATDTLGEGGSLRPEQLQPEDGGGIKQNLRDTFNAEQQQEAGQEDPQMLKYIEAELAKRRGGAGGAAEGATEAAEGERRGGGKRDDEGADRWLAGIEEVSLPMEYKLRNIEATEKRKAELLAEAAGGGGGSEPSAVAADFARFAMPWQETGRAGNVARDAGVAKRFKQTMQRRH